jgi:hypothetical protein
MILKIPYSLYLRTSINSEYSDTFDVPFNCKKKKEKKMRSYVKRDEEYEKMR